MADRTCSTCAHWRKHDINPLDLSAPRRGECRERLHALMLAQRGPNGPEAAGWICGFPIVPADFPACGQYRAGLVLTLASNGGGGPHHE